jgi:putative membrane-bound dehydrogenase-like protein
MTAVRPLAVAALAVTLAAGRLAAQGFSPEEAVRRMKVPDGFRVQLVAAEPMIRQPVSISFDDRGRMWVLQYLQFPYPAGLKPVQVDQYLRTVWDRVPEPPPKGPRGADKITILSDPDEHGRYRKSKDFVTGLNLASGFAIGHGGVFVAQPPYLLFYPDRDGDDVPDGDPEVLLTGFGMEDSHAFANSLQWGPDGWLYGAHGSTVTANIRGISFQQGIWRYHPITKEFELFSEGGGNTWGLDFDRHGNAIAGTNWGGYAMLHQVQGGYYIKGFGKHGPLHNPHTFGYFDHVPYKGFKGGHVTCGGVLYRGGAFPEEFNDVYIAGNLLSNALYWHVLERKGSSFTAHHGGDFLVANDTWFRPIDCLVGPDGALYVADWYDKRAAHINPIDTWDKTNGRVYKVEREGAGPWVSPNLGKMSSRELVGLLGHRNSWYAGEARRILGERRDPSVIPVLRKLIAERTDDPALEALWALCVSGGFNDDIAASLLKHANEDVRAWTVRLLGDPKRVAPALAARLAELAATEPSPTVRSQLACTAKRLPAAEGLPIVRALLHRGEDVDDPHIPLLIWWAIEDKAVSDRAAVLALFDGPDLWKQPLVGRTILERVGRRYLAEGGEADLAAVARLLTTAPTPADVGRLVAGLEKALEGRHLTAVPPALAGQLAAVAPGQVNNPAFLRLSVRLGATGAFEKALARAADSKAPEAERLALVELLGQTARPEALPVLLGLLRDGGREPVRGAALPALAAYPDATVADTVLSLYPKLPAALRPKAVALLAGRPAWGLALVRAVDAGHVPAKDVPLDQVRRVSEYKDAAAEPVIAKHWGKVAAATPGEKRARITALGMSLSAGKGDAVSGKAVFTQTCATCHQLFGAGNKVGPDLTGAERKNRDSMLLHIVDPSAVIRPEFVAYTLETTDGRTLTGLVAESTPEAVTLLDGRNERTVVPRSRIETMATSPVSLMPEKLLDTLTDQQVRDLFAYLQGDGPPPDRGK